MSLRFLRPSALRLSRSFSTTQPRNQVLCEKQINRKVIKVEGVQASEFLQGLITNDMEHLVDGKRSMYCMFLNVKGRVLADSIIFADPSAEGRFLIDCDAIQAPTLFKHLKIYKVRRKVDIAITDRDVWTVFDDEIKGEETVEPRTVLAAMANLPGSIHCDKKTPSSSDMPDIPCCSAIVSAIDPRLPDLGCRAITPKECDLATCFPTAQPVDYAEKAFLRHRHRLGVSEGSFEIPSGKALPLECNGDYMHGVSFHKGCYIGQELTARTHHTGVVRKRIMPIKVNMDESDADIDFDSSIVNEKGKEVGKLRSNAGPHSLGLMRIAEALSAEFLDLKGNCVIAEKPFWWPKEQSKSARPGLK